ncbi:MAG: DUF7305 domain-containing protein [Planctomycetota bacterium]|jgi:hypothetical protein
MNKFVRQENERGTALILALIIMIIIMGLSSAYLIVSVYHAKDMNWEIEGVRAQFLAETAVNHAMYDISIGGSGDLVNSFAGGTYQADVTDCENDGVDNNGDGDIDEEDEEDFKIIIGTGTFERTAKQVEVIIKKRDINPFEKAAFGDQGVNLDGFVDSYDSDCGSYTDQTTNDHGDGTTCDLCGGDGIKDNGQPCTQCNPCTTCSGSGSISCTNCGGAGSSTCGDCGGSGTGGCTDCGGGGTVTCSDCGGDGDVVNCATCSGAGTLPPCATCSGAGTVSSSCGTCGGDGINVVSCVPCGGDGISPQCSTCSGAGTITGTCGFCQGTGRTPPNCTACGGDGIKGGGQPCNQCTVCANCGGSGTGPITCTDCGGTGGGGSCPNCGGDGQVETSCTDCGGDGTTETSCSDCGGTGGGGACADCGGSGIASMCAPCSGSGSVSCATCSGSGGAGTCATCSGSGTVSCSTCSASGSIECPDCGGTGRDFGEGGSIPYANGNGDVGSNHNVVIGGGYVFGDAVAGPTGSTTVGADAYVDGSTDPNTTEQPMPPVTYNPVGTPDGNLTSGALSGGTYRYDSVQVSGQSSLTISGDVILYVDGDFMTSGQGVITVTEGASLTIFQGSGDMHIAGQGIVNLTNAPTKLFIYSATVTTGTGDNRNNFVHINGQAAFAGAVYAPGADIKVNGQTVNYGALIGRSLESCGNGKCEIHYDEALARVKTDWTSGFSIMAWRNLQATQPE